MARVAHRTRTPDPVKPRSNAVQTRSNADSVSD
jgi:hypothetical protein